MKEETVRLIGQFMFGIPLGLVAVVFAIGCLCMFIKCTMNEWDKNKWEVIIPFVMGVWFIVALILATYRS